MEYRRRMLSRKRAVRLRRTRRVGLALAVAVGIVWGEVALVGQLTDRPEADTEVAVLAGDGSPVAGLALPVPEIEQVEAATSPCDSDISQQALVAKDPAAVLDAFGGAASLHEAIRLGAAQCVPLDDPSLPWVVVNKQRPLSPVDFAPSGIMVPPSSIVRSGLRPELIEPFEALVAAAAAEGAGRITLFSGYRSHATQVSTYQAQVDSLGVSEADSISARPGYSEHQLGLAADVVACDGGCGTIYQLGDTAQGRWLAENAWRFGWIVRYEHGHTDTTGYSPEPWHLRYIGEELAAVYHEGGFHTLEDFFGLPAAPGYE